MQEIGAEKTNILHHPEWKVVTRMGKEGAVFLGSYTPQFADIPKITR